MFFKRQAKKKKMKQASDFYHKYKKIMKEIKCVLGGGGYMWHKSLYSKKLLFVRERK